MRILVGCEFSGIVRDAFIRAGHDAMSCDLLPTEAPGPHYQGDVLDILGDGWDMDLWYNEYMNHAPIPGFPAYRIYPHGVIESKWRSGMFYSGFEIEDVWKRPKLRKHEAGYLGIDLRDGHGGRRRTYLHILVAEVFIGPKPFPKAVVRHLDGKVTNNDVSNLAWGTYKQNEDDKIQHGTWNTRNGGARLTPGQVEIIRQRCGAGERQQDLADEFAVSRPTISRIASNTTWVKA